MRNMVSQRRRSGRSGFIRVAQTDANEPEPRQLSGRARFRETVQQVLQQTPSPTPHDINPPSAQSSPALSDSSIIKEDYMSLPAQQFDDVDLTDTHRGYAEVLGSYGPEVADNDFASDFYSIKAGKDLEVCVKSYPLDISPNGLCVDDHLQDYSYQGSEGNIEKPPADFSSPYNYRPVPLRWQFILIVFGGLLAFLALSELSLRFLPDASDMDEFLPAFQNISEIRKRSGHHDDGGHGGHFTGPDNGTQANIPSSIGSTTETSSSAKMSSSITGITRTTETTSTTSSTKSIPTTPTTSIGSITTTSSSTDAASTTKVTKITSTTSMIETAPITKASSSTEITSTIESSSSTEASPTASTTLTTSTIRIISTTESREATTTMSTTSATSATSIVEVTSTPETIETSKGISTTEPNSPTSVENQTTSPMKSSTIETVAASTSKTQDDQSSATPSQITEVTISENKPSETATLSLSQPSESPPPVTDFPTTEQHTAIPTPNGPGPGDNSSPAGPISSTQTQPDVTPTGDHENSPIPSPSHDTTTLQETTNLPPSPTADSPHSTTNRQSPDITSPNPLPGSGTKPTDSSSLGPDPTNIPSPSGPGTTSPGKQATDEHPAQGSSQPTNVKSPDSVYPTNDQPKAQPTDNGKDQPGDQPAGPDNDDAGASLSSSHSIQPVVTSSQTIQTFDLTRTMKHKTDSTSTPTQLPESSEKNPEENEPFATFTLTQGTETPLPIMTTAFTTSSSVSGGRFVEVTMMTTIFGHVKAANPLTDFITTTTYANGTVSTISKNVYDEVLTETVYDSTGKPMGTRYIHVLNSAQLTTLKNSLGYGTATVDYYDVESTVTLYNSDNIATATVTTIIHETKSLSTIYDANGRPIKTTILLRPILTNSEVAPPTPTSTSSPGSNSQPTLELHRLSDEIYFVGLMLPTLLTIFLFIPIKILNRNVKLYQGFHVLASDRGAGASESLCLGTTGPTSFLRGLWSLQRGNYLLGLTSVLVILSAFAVPFSAEVFRLILQGPQCHAGESDEIECSVALGVFPAPAQVLSALLILLIIGIILVAVLLRRWKTGVEWDPWNILNMAQLAAGTDIRKVLERLRRHRRASTRVDAKDFINKLHGKTLGLREWEENGAMKYSVLILTKEVEDLAERPTNKAGRSVAFANPNAHQRRRLRWPTGDHVPFSILSLTGRILFMFFLSGVLIAVLTYDIVARGSEYRRGLTGKAVGVRFLFSGAGVIVSFAWGSFFNAVAFLSPYKLLQRRRLNKGEAIAVSPATNPFTGIWLAFVPSRRDLFLGVVAITSVISEFLPLFLGNIPCNGVQLEIAETVSVYLSVAVLSIMIFIVGGSFFIDWPTTMGADPSTIAGAMYIAHVLSVAQPMRRFFKDEGAGIV